MSLVKKIISDVYRDVTHFSFTYILRTIIRNGSRFVVEQVRFAAESIVLVNNRAGVVILSGEGVENKARKLPSKLPRSGAKLRPDFGGSPE